MSEEATLAQLRQSLGLLQVAFDAAAEAMVIVEPGGEVRWGNQAAADLWTNGLAIMLVGQAPGAAAPNNLQQQWSAVGC